MRISSTKNESQKEKSSLPIQTNVFLQNELSFFFCGEMKILLKL